jgi:Na+/proline symporter
MQAPARPALHGLDWAAIASYVGVCIALALWLWWRRASQKGAEGFALAGRRLPWWIIGIADVATGDGADAFWVYVFFVGGFVGIHRFYWVTAIFALPLGIFWARYYRRLALPSPGSFFEARYGGRGARAFRVASTVYGVGIGHSVLIGYVLRGFAQSLAPMLGWSQGRLLGVFFGLALAYTLVSGLFAVVYMDLLQFALVMLGRLTLAALLLSAAGGLTAVLQQATSARGAAFLTWLPLSSAGDAARFGAFALDPLSLGALAIYGLWNAANHQIPAVQKSLAARDENHAALGQLLNALLSLGVRTLPLILIGLCAVALLPAPRSGVAPDTNQWAALVGRYAPPGLYGLLLVGVIAGYTSTLAGFLNYSGSILLSDVYLCAVRPRAGEREQLAAARILTLLVAGVSNLWAWLLLKHIDGAWMNFIGSVVSLFVLPVGMLRWIWWRQNLYAELIGFVLGFPLAYVAWFGLPHWSFLPAWVGAVPAFKDLPYWLSFACLFGVGLGVQVLVSLLTPAEPRETLVAFYQRCNPPGFWGPIVALAEPDPARRRARRRAQYGEIRAGVYASAFAATLVLGMSALIVQRFIAGLSLLLVALLLSLRVVARSLRRVS